MEYILGIVNIDDELHEQIRKACSVSQRSINAQAAFWIKIGMMAELEPNLTYNQIMGRELKAVGLETYLVASARND